MEPTTVARLKQQFDQLAQNFPEDHIEFWFARDLMKPLGYVRWENFLAAIRRAITACDTTGHGPDDHFRGVTKMIETGKGAQRPVDDFLLTRYACYLIAQNGDPRKEPIAFAQSYFAVQTRKQEVIEERLRLTARLDARERLRESEKGLSQNIYERGVDDAGFGGEFNSEVRHPSIVGWARCGSLGTSTCKWSRHDFPPPDPNPTVPDQQVPS